MDFNDLLNLMIQQQASDLFITANVEPSMKIHGQIVPVAKVSSQVKLSVSYLTQL